MSKYHNIKTYVDNILFDSIAEAEYYIYLKSEEKMGHISDLQLQVPFMLQSSYKNNRGQRIRAIKYIADFVFNRDGEKVIVDVKGKQTEAFKIKWKMLGMKYPDYILEIISV